MRTKGTSSNRENAGDLQYVIIRVCYLEDVEQKLRGSVEVSSTGHLSSAEVIPLTSA